MQPQYRCIAACIYICPVQYLGDRDGGNAEKKSAELLLYIYAQQHHECAAEIRHPVYLLNGEPDLANIAAGLPVLLCRMLDAVMGRNLWTHSLSGPDWSLVADRGDLDGKAACCACQGCDSRGVSQCC